MDKMRLDDMLLQMAYAASQAASSTLPTVDRSSQEGGTTDFRTLLDEKKTGAAAQDQPAADSGKDSQTAAGDLTDPAFAAMMQNSGIQMSLPVLMNQAQTTVPGAEANQSAAAVTAVAQPAMETGVPAVNGAETAGGQMAAGNVAGAAADETVQPNGTVHESAEVTVEPAAEGDGPQQLTQVQGATVETRSAAQNEQEGESLLADHGDGTSQSRKAQVDESQAGAVVSQPLFQDSEAMPQRVGDAPVLDTESADFEAKLTDEVQTALKDGSQRIELKLTPEHLGRVVVEMNRSPEGVLHVVLHAENEQAVKILSEHTSTLSMLLQNGQQGEVRVEVQHTQQNEQPWQQQDQNSQHQGEQQQQQQHRQQKSELFLQQLRLGLIDVESQ